MKLNNKIKLICVMGLTAQGALAAVDNYVDVGLNYVSKQSFKFGEYNGLYESGINGNFGILGGDAFSSPTGTKLWSVTGSDVGTTSRNLTGSMSDQGKWKLKVGYDELRHNSTDSYVSPLQGNMGGNSFSLPTDFGTVLTTVNGTRTNISAAQYAEFQPREVYTTRKNTSLNSTYVIAPHLNIQFDYNHLDQSGAKLLGAPNQGTIAAGGTTGKAEAINIILNPTRYTTDQFTAGLNWYTEKSYLNLGYYGSIFRDGFDSVTYQDAMVTAAATCSGSACFTTQRMSTAPNNNFHQLSLNGGYDFTPATKLTGGFSYGRNTQDQDYISTVVAQTSSAGTFDHMQNVANALPATSLNGLVVSTHADLKVTNQTTNDLVLGAGMKYNKRLDKTASKTYRFKDISSSATATTATNAPYSNSKLESELSADYRITKDQKIRFAFNRENIHRWCDGIASGYECIASPKSRENILSALYKIRATDTLRFNTGYIYANKQGEFNHLYVGNVEGTGSGAPSNSGSGTKTTTNGGNIAGFESRLFASRQENIIKAGTDWSPIEDLDFALSGRYIQDKYEALLGEHAYRGKSASFDTTYTLNQHHTIALFSNWQSGYRDIQSSANGTVNSIGNQFWSNRIKDDVYALGLGSQHTGLLDGKMEVTADLSYSMEKTKWTTIVSYLPTCGAAGTMSCGSIEAKNKQTTFKLTDSYLVSKNGKVSLGYTFQHNSNDDFYYNLYEQGYTSSALMPTNEKAPNYTVHLVTAGYTYLF